MTEFAIMRTIEEAGLPQTTVLMYREQDGIVPIHDWLDGLQPKARQKCLVRIRRLRELGYELRRPEADYLRDGVFELRVGFQGRHLRVLYFFHEASVAVLSHGIVKETIVPPREIEWARLRKQKFAASPRLHTHEEIEG